MLRAHAAAYLAWRGERASWIERCVLAQLTACGTAAMGDHSWYCDSCGEVQVAYNSCRNRHCPTCRGAARAQWLDRLRATLLPVSYFHVIFTLPHELSRLILANRRLLYGLLFQAAAAALLELAADPRYLGARLGLLMVLHTWGQLMQHHAHLHCVLPAGGLSLDGTQWVHCREKFLVPVNVLSELFRGKYLAGLKRLWRQGKLKLDDKLSDLSDQRRFECWLSTLYEKNWNVYCQAPLEPDQGPEPVLKYLARYVAGVAISDRRLVSHENGQVTFRWKNYARGGRAETQSLSGLEFVARYMLHVLPRGLVRIRYYGMLSNRNRKRDLARCRELLGATTDASPEAACLAAPAVQPASSVEQRQCPICGRGRLLPLQSSPRPSWRQLMARQIAAWARPASLTPSTWRRQAKQSISCPSIPDTS